MITAGIITGVTIVDSGATLYARIRGQDGNLITQASVSTITYDVHNVSLNTVVATAQSLTVSSVVFDSLQQGDIRWDVDSANKPGKDGSYGYNFRASIPATSFTTFDVESITNYRQSADRFLITVEFTPVSGAVFRQPFMVTAIPTYP